MTIHIHALTTWPAAPQPSQQQPEHSPEIDVTAERGRMRRGMFRCFCEMCKRIRE